MIGGDAGGRWTYLGEWRSRSCLDEQIGGGAMEWRQERE
jgi:hypothetical protein